MNLLRASPLNSSEEFSYCLEAFTGLPEEFAQAIFRAWKSRSPTPKSRREFLLLANFMFPGGGGLSASAIHAHGLSEGGGDLLGVRADCA